MRPAGMLGPRFLPERRFGPPLPLTGCCLRGLLDLFFGFEALAAGGAFGVKGYVGKMVGSWRSNGN